MVLCFSALVWWLLADDARSHDAANQRRRAASGLCQGDSRQLRPLFPERTLCAVQYSGDAAGYHLGRLTLCADYHFTLEPRFRDEPGSNCPWPCGLSGKHGF